MTVLREPSSQSIPVQEQVGTGAGLDKRTALIGPSLAQLPKKRKSGSCDGGEGRGKKIVPCAFPAEDG